MNDTEREQWIDNDEGLYNLMRASRKSKRKFVRENREMIDSAISSVVNAKPRSIHEINLLHG